MPSRSAEVGPGRGAVGTGGFGVGPRPGSGDPIEIASELTRPVQPGRAERARARLRDALTPARVAVEGQRASRALAARRVEWGAGRYRRRRRREPDGDRDDPTGSELGAECRGPGPAVLHGREPSRNPRVSPFSAPGFHAIQSVFSSLDTVSRHLFRDRLAGVAWSGSVAAGERAEIWMRDTTMLREPVEQHGLSGMGTDPAGRGVAPGKRPRRSPPLSGPAGRLVTARSRPPGTSRNAGGSPGGPKSGPGHGEDPWLAAALLGHPAEQPASGPAGPPHGQEHHMGPGEAAHDHAADQVIDRLAWSDPIAGVGDPDGALAALDALSISELLDTLAALEARGQLDTLRATIDLDAEEAIRVRAALRALAVSWLGPEHAAPEALGPLAEDLEQLGQDEQFGVYRHMIARRQGTPDLHRLLEGVIAMESAGVPRSEPAAAGITSPGPAPAPIEPGPWHRPGDQPTPFYIGNEAHRWIGLHYGNHHKGETIALNHTPVSSILKRLRRAGHRPNAEGLSKSDLALRPDILNLSRLCVYEIKPAAAASVGAAQAALYIGTLARAGITVSLGPSADPGARGQLPAPGGVFMFLVTRAGGDRLSIPSRSPRAGSCGPGATPGKARQRGLVLGVRAIDPGPAARPWYGRGGHGHDDPAHDPAGAGKRVIHRGRHDVTRSVLRSVSRGQTRDQQDRHADAPGQGLESRWSRSAACYTLNRPRA